MTNSFVNTNVRPSIRPLPCGSGRERSMGSSTGADPRGAAEARVLVRARDVPDHRFHCQQGEAQQGPSQGNAGPYITGVFVCVCVCVCVYLLNCT